jgi:hypothetical protein
MALPNAPYKVKYSSKIENIGLDAQKIVMFILAQLGII